MLFGKWIRLTSLEIVQLKYRLKEYQHPKLSISSFSVSSYSTTDIVFHVGAESKWSYLGQKRLQIVVDCVQIRARELNHAATTVDCRVYSVWLSHVCFDI